MTIPVDISKFPKQYHTDLRNILYDLAEIHRLHKDAHIAMCVAHSYTGSDKYKKIDDATFRTVELYRLQLDQTNKYCAYLEKNDLVKYIENAQKNE